MKILILTDKLGEYSGWDRYSFDLISHLQQKGNEVVVVCRERNEDYSTIIQLPLLPHPLAFKKTYLFASWYSRKIVTKLAHQNFSPDIIHCVVEPFSGIARKVSETLKIPYSITTHGSYGIRPLGVWSIGWLHRRAYEHAYTIVCVSHYTEKIIKEAFPKVHTLVITNGINWNTFKIEENFNKNLKENIILGVGALKEHKGYEFSVAAMKQICEIVPHAQYYIVGNTHDKKYVAKITNLISKFGLTKNIHLLGKISDEELKNLYKKAKVFMLTPISKKDSFEGFGLVYLEANAYGIPVIGSYDTGGEDAIKDGETGFLTKPYDSKSIAEAGTKLLTLQNEAYQKFSEQAVAWAKVNSWDKIVERYLDLLRKIKETKKI